MSLSLKPFAVARPYIPVGRHLLVRDPIEGWKPGDDVFPYTRDVRGKASILNHKQAELYFSGQDARPADEVSYRVQPEKLWVPPIVIYSEPYAVRKDIDACPHPLMANARDRAADAVLRAEDNVVLETLLHAVPADHIVAVSGTAQPMQFITAMCAIESHELSVEEIVMHPSRYKDVRCWGRDFYDEATLREIEKEGVYGCVFHAKIRVTTAMPKNVILLTAHASYVGAMPVYQDLADEFYEITNDEERDEEGNTPPSIEGVRVAETIGAAVVNDYAAAKIVFTDY